MKTISVLKGCCPTCNEIIIVKTTKRRETNSFSLNSSIQATHCSDKLIDFHYIELDKYVFLDINEWKIKEV